MISFLVLDEVLLQMCPTGGLLPLHISDHTPLRDQIGRSLCKATRFPSSVSFGLASHYDDAVSGV
jgi:hypothetical protein